jgi:hypothetical protein
MAVTVGASVRGIVPHHRDVLPVDERLELDDEVDDLAALRRDDNADEAGAIDVDREDRLTLAHPGYSAK